jgi:hypothetical protein
MDGRGNMVESVMVIVVCHETTVYNVGCESMKLNDVVCQICYTSWYVSQGWFVM